MKNITVSCRLDTWLAKNEDEEAILVMIIKHVMLQLFFALLPFILFNVYYRDKLQNYSKKFIIITSSLSLFLAMTFSCNLNSGFYFDVRHIIMYFGVIFGGLQTGCILLIEFFVYRLYIGGDGIWTGSSVFLCTFFLSLFFNQIYKSTHRMTLVTCMAGIVLSIHPTLILYLNQPHMVTNYLFEHMVVFPLQYLIGIWLLTTLFHKAASDKALFINCSQNEKFEAISHVAASLAHEVRNPLTAVKGFLKLIRYSSLEQRKIEQYIDISLMEIDRTESVISEYLSIAKPPSKQKGKTNLSHQVQVIIDVMASYAIMSNVEIELEHKPVVPVWIIANGDEVKQVLVNFMKNAIEACVEIPQAKVSLSLNLVDRNVLLIIKDNGVGMSADQISRLGSIYYSTKSSGTGLGLTYSFQVIRAMGGSIAVQSEPSEGTRFTISIPLLDYAQETPATRIS